MTLVILVVPSDPFYPSPNDDGILEIFYKGTILAPSPSSSNKKRGRVRSLDKPSRAPTRIARSISGQSRHDPAAHLVFHRRSSNASPAPIGRGSRVMWSGCYLRNCTAACLLVALLLVLGPLPSVVTTKVPDATLTCRTCLARLLAYLHSQSDQGGEKKVTGKEGFWFGVGACIEKKKTDLAVILSCFTLGKNQCQR